MPYIIKLKDNINITEQSGIWGTGGYTYSYFKCNEVEYKAIKNYGQSGDCNLYFQRKEDSVWITVIQASEWVNEDYKHLISDVLPSSTSPLSNWLQSNSNVVESDVWSANDGFLGASNYNVHLIKPKHKVVDWNYQYWRGQSGNSYLKLVSGSEKNALGLANSAWGRTMWKGSNKFRYKKDIIPLVDKNCAYLITPNLTSSYSPYTVNYEFSAASRPQLYFRFNSASQRCEYSLNNSTWYNACPGCCLFFAFTAGGGAGGNGKAAWGQFGASGGGGGASAIGVIDLSKNTNNTVKFTLGTGGKVGSGEGDSGGAGNSSCLYINETKILELKGGGGGAMGNKKSGGAGGKSSPTAEEISGKESEWDTNYALKIFSLYYGKAGGPEGQGVGESFANDVRIASPIFNEDDMPYENNGTRGQGQKASWSSGANCHGGGGGQTILSNGNSIRGSGGYGGYCKQWDWWHEGTDGGNAVFQVLSVYQ